VVTAEDIIRARRVVNTIYVDDKVRDYIVDMVLATRDPQAYGSTSTATFKTALRRAPRSISRSPRAPRRSSNGRGYVTPQDVKTSRSTCCAIA
jgi:MoxR-like ATPase